MKYSQLLKALTLTLSIASSSAIAVTQGSLGATSTGDLLISLDINSLVQVSNLGDIALGTYAGTDLTGTDNFCVYRNGVGNYAITMSGDGGVFELSDGGINTLPYSVDFTNGATTALTSTVALTAQTGANTTSTTCAGVDNVAVAITVANANLAAAPAGNYTGTLTILVAPE